MLSFLITISCYSQSKEFTIKEIDSICSLKKASSHSYGVIEIHNDKNKVIGSGGTGIATYSYNFDQEKINNLSSKEIKTYDLEKNIVLIKADYHQAIYYKNSYTENVYSEFYYQNNALFNIRIKVIRTEKNKKEHTELFEYTIEELNEAKSIKNILLFDVQAWVRDKNKEILDFYNKK